MFRRLLCAFGGKQNNRSIDDSAKTPDVGSVDHHTDTVDTIKQLKREQRHDEAESYSSGVSVKLNRTSSTTLRRGTTNIWQSSIGRRTDTRMRSESLNAI